MRLDTKKGENDLYEACDVICKTLSQKWKCANNWRECGERLKELMNEENEKTQSWRIRGSLRNEVQIFKYKGDVHLCSNYRGIKLMRHTLKIWESVFETRLRREEMIGEQQHGSLLRNSTTESVFAFIVLMEKYRRSKGVVLCVCISTNRVW